MTIFTNSYYPTLCLRRAEMKAMENLPTSEKAKMRPIVLLAPWLNSIRFQNSFDTVEKSIGIIPIIVDLDRDYRSNSPHESRQYFRDLLSGSGADNLWIELVRSHDNYVPCIQNFGNDDQIASQVAAFRELGRGIVFRVPINVSGQIEFVSKWLDDSDLANQLVVLEGGWADFTLEQQDAFTTKIEKLLGMFPAVRFVVSSSNFPNAFTNLDDMASVTIDSRRLYSSLFERFGNYQMFYGDWGSTKPRRYDGGGSKPLERIDFPTKTKWIIARSKEQEWDFVAAAKRITRLEEWKGRPEIWGVKLIEKTALNLPGAITTGPQSIAARVNIHLFLQNNYATQNIRSVPTISEWVDPI